MAWIPIAASVVGGLLGGSGGGGSGSTSQNLLDPRMASYLYGDTGLLNGANSLYQQQSAQGGLNPLQTAGMEMQRQALMDPAYTQGYGAMRSLGLGLMGQGVAGNPFTQSAAAMPQQQAQQQGGMRTIQPIQGGMRSALGFSPLGGMTAPTQNPLAAAFMPIQQGTAAPMARPAQAPPDLMAMLQQLLARQQQQQIGGAAAGDAGGGASGTGPGQGSSGTGIGGANGDGSGSPY